MVDSDRSRRGAALAIGGWMLAVAGVVTALAVMSAVQASERVEVPDPTVADVTEVIVALLLATLGAGVVLRGRSTRYGWVLLAAGVSTAVSQGSGEVALHGWYVSGSPSIATDVAIWVQGHWAVFFAFVSLLLPALFPDGRPVPRLRRPVRLLAAGWFITAVLAAVADVPAENAFLDLADPPNNPLGFLPVPLDLLNMAWVALTVASFGVSFASLRARWNEDARQERQQLKWVLLSLGVCVAVVFFAMVNVLAEEVAGVDVGLGWLESAIPLTWSVVVIALGLGVLRYRLYDVDLVINRTIVFGVMSVLVVAAYAATVTAASSVTGIDDSGASLLGAGLVALAFAPARDFVQRRVNRLLFGRRDDPVGVLTELGRRLEHAGAPRDTMQTLAEMIVAALKVPGAALELDLDHGGTVTVVVGEIATVGESAEERPLRHQGVHLGRMVIARRRRGAPLQAEDNRLLDSLAHHAAALVSAVRLQIALQQSRERLVAAREEERRRLRRDLHDGLGPSLASQMFRLDAARRLVKSDPERAAAALTDLEGHTRELVADIRRLVDDLRPPALDELGLAGALAAHAGQVSRAGMLRVHVEAEPDPLGPLPAAVEVAAYRIATEALTNTIRHAGARHCRFRVERRSASLLVRISDDGAGLPADLLSGVGLTSMRERADELGGDLTISSHPDEGTTVEAVLPLSIVVDHEAQEVPTRG